MRGVLLWCVLACLVTPLCGAADAPRVAVVRTQEAAPTLDGDLGDACWGQAFHLTDFVNYDDGSPAPLPIEGWVLLGTDHLYLAYRCVEEPGVTPLAEAATDSETVIDDDTVEIFISPFRTGREMLHLLVNSRGAKWPEANAWATLRGIETAARQRPDGWQVEIALPLAATGVSRLGPGVGWQWRFNMSRQRRGTQREEGDFNWSCIHSHWGDVAWLGILQANPEAPLVVEGWSAPPARWGSGNTAALTLRARRPVEVALGCQAAGRTSWTRAGLRAGERRQVEGAYTVQANGRPANRERLAMHLSGGEGVSFGLSVPVTAPAPALLFVEEPNYRGYLWPETKRVRGFVELPMTEATRRQTACRVTLQAGDKVVQTPGRYQDGRVTFDLDARWVPVGPATLSFRATERATGKVVAEQTAALRRFSEAERAALPTYIDPYNRLIVGGKPFFPLGWYGGRREGQIEEMRAGGFNCVLDYGMNHWSLAEIKAYLDHAEQVGMKIVYCNNDLYPQAVQGKTKEGWSGDRIVEGIVDTFKSHPAVIAWYLNDERPPEMLPELTDYYERVKAHDPGHPGFIVLCDMANLHQFPHTTDIMGVDPYPIPRAITSVIDQAEIAHRGVRGIEPVWVVPQAFGWYQYSKKALPEAIGGRGRVPTMQELVEGREPTFEEERAMTWLALNHGAKGLIYYCYYDHRVLPTYELRYAGMKRLAAEINELMPVLLTTEQVKPGTFTCDNPEIDLGVWRHEGSYYLAAVNKGLPEQLATIKGPFGAVETLFEDGRAVTVKGGKLGDWWRSQEVHVYRVNTR